METRDYLRYIVDKIHTVVIATVDEKGLPVTAAIDIMDADENSLYFLTAKGKGFYDRLKDKGFLAFTALKGEDTMSSIAVSIRGNVREIGSDRLKDLFDKNPYMYEIYPTKESMQALTVFQIYKGNGEWFDLSTKPITRVNFVLGGDIKKQEGYYILDNCIGCGKCLPLCPQSCIASSGKPFVIEQEHCLHCGNCLSVCPVSAVERRYIA